MSDGNEKCFVDTGVAVCIKELVPNPDTGTEVLFFKTDGPTKAMFNDDEDDVYEVYSETIAKHMIVHAEGRRFIIKIQDVVQALRAHLRPDDEAQTEEPAA